MLQPSSFNRLLSSNFDKPINELSYTEAALLAALPKAPNNYNPKTNYKVQVQQWPKSKEEFCIL